MTKPQWQERLEGEKHHVNTTGNGMSTAMYVENESEKIIQNKVIDYIIPIVAEEMAELEEQVMNECRGIVLLLCGTGNITPTTFNLKLDELQALRAKEY